VVATFPSGKGALVAAFSFYLGEQNAFGRLGLCEGGDGQSPKPEKADDSFGFEAGDLDIHFYRSLNQMSNYKNKQKRAKDCKRFVRFDEIQGISMVFLRVGQGNGGVLL